MSIGIVDDNDFILELERLGGTTGGTTIPALEDRTDDVKEGVVINQERPGRNEGDLNVPDSLRQIIGEESVINGRKAALQLAEEFGVSPSSVSAYAKGATSTKTYDTPSSSIIKHINKSRQRATTRAGNVLNRALGAITQEKLDYADVRDLSTIAKDMSAIIKNLEPSNEGQDTDLKPQPQFVIFAPQFRDERSYETIQVMDTE